MRMFLIFSLVCSAFVASAQRNPVTWNAKAKQIEGQSYQVKITAAIKSGWYVYAQKLESDMGPVPTSLAFQGVEAIGEASESGNRKEGMDKAFGMNVVKYEDNVTFSQKVKVPEGTDAFKCTVTFMTCNGEMCLPPKDIELLVQL